MDTPLDLNHIAHSLWSYLLNGNPQVLADLVKNLFDKAIDIGIPVQSKYPEHGRRLSAKILNLVNSLGILPLDMVV